MQSNPVQCVHIYFILYLLYYINTYLYIHIGHNICIHMLNDQTELNE